MNPNDPNNSGQNPTPATGWTDPSVGGGAPVPNPTEPVTTPMPEPTPAEPVVGEGAPAGDPVGTPTGEETPVVPTTDAPTV